MVFSSITFLFYFLPIVIAIYYLCPKNFRNVILLIASLIFYFFGEPKYLFLMIISIIYTYIFGLLINRFRNSKYSKVILFFSIAIIIWILIYFKYIDFLLQNISLLFNKKIDALGVILPIGISFYTFQMVSYLVDVHKENCNVQKNFLKLATYICLFPQLIAGPIVRYTEIEKQLEDRVYSIEKFSSGVRRFIVGLAKKVLLANTFGELINIYGTFQDGTLLFAWMYGACNMLQIYFDFSGYSDMAIGLGKMFGFEFTENFNYPYIATSITDFWRRWHISLSKWFRDYVYIPLGGNRVGIIKQIRNILIVWLLTGLWHGASWNFVLWGLYFGIILLVEKFAIKNNIEKIPKVLRAIVVLIIVMISFIIFSANNLNEAFWQVKSLLPIVNKNIMSNTSLYYLKSYFITFIIAIIGATPFIKKVIQKMNKRITNTIEPFVLISLFIVSVSYIIDGSFNPFLYFRF